MMRKEDDLIIGGDPPKKKGIGAIIDNIFWTIFLIIPIIVLIVSAGKLYSIMTEYNAGVNEYSDIADTVILERDAAQEEIEELQQAEIKAVKQWEAPFTVDFEKLKSINEDVVGWLYIEAIPSITYPVVRGKDNSFYLHKTYKGEDNFAGAIFEDCNNAPDFSDQNTIVYGHNMKNGSMFGELKKFKEKETIDKSKYFWILTPEANYKYEIFSIHVADVNGEVYTLIKGPGKDTIEYGEKMRAQSLFNVSDREFVETDRFVTFSTCTGDEKTRLVVQGVQLDPSGAESPDVKK